jgi:hypothetical protein
MSDTTTTFDGPEPTEDDVLPMLRDLDEVDRIVDHKKGGYSVLLAPEGTARFTLQAVRVRYLEEYRFDWEWVRDNKNSPSPNHNGYVLLRRRED